MTSPIPDLAAVQRIQMTSSQTLAYRRIRGGREPLLLIRGFPCTSPIWARTMQPLAAAGFDVVAVDLRGYGDSDEPPDGFYDLAAFGADLEVLTAALAWSSMTIAAHDLGASLAIDLAHRRSDLVDGLFLMNHVIPAPDADAVAGFASWSPEEARSVFAYAEEQGHDANGLLRRLADTKARRAYVESFYTSRGWCPKGAFTTPELDLLVEPYLDPRRVRASFRDYEVAAGRHPASLPERVHEPTQQPVMVLLGPEDVTLIPDAAARCQSAYSDLVDIQAVPNSGHFMQRISERTTVSGCSPLPTQLKACHTFLIASRHGR